MNENEMQDFKLNSSQGPASDDASRKRPIWPYLLIAVVVVGALIYFLRSDDESEPSVEPAVEQTAEAKAVERVEDETGLEIGEVPALEASDPWLRGVVQQLTSHPEIASWLVTDELARTSVVVIDNIAEGRAPSSHLEFLAPKEGFQVRQADGKTVIDSESYHRYDGIIEVIESIDTEGAGELYRAMEPMLQQAYVELGYPGQSFEVTLSRAIQRLLAVPVVEGPIEVEAGVSSFKYRDQKLEQLSPAAKQFLRLGPDNLRRLQAKVRALARSAGIATG